MAENVAREKGILRKEQISIGLWRRFIEQQFQLSLCQADSTAHVHMDAISPAQYFDLH